MRLSNPEQYREHVQQWCRTMNTTILFGAPIPTNEGRANGAANLLTREIVVSFRRIETLDEYLVTMHELGHLATMRAWEFNPTLYSISPDYCLKVERDAWLWARENSLHPWDLQCDTRMNLALDSYAARFRFPTYFEVLL